MDRRRGRRPLRRPHLRRDRLALPDHRRLLPDLRLRLPPVDRVLDHQHHPGLERGLGRRGRADRRRVPPPGARPGGRRPARAQGGDRRRGALRLLRAQPPRPADRRARPEPPDADQARAPGGADRRALPRRTAQRRSAQRRDSVPATPAPAPEPTSPLRAFGLALIATSFTYGGYQQTINFGSEVRDAARVVPRAIGLGLAIIISVYLLINLAYVHVIGFDALGGAESIAALLAGAAYGPAAGDALAILLFLSVLGYVNVAMLTNPRLLLAMSEDAALPGFLGRRSARGAPVAALTLFTALALVALFAAQTFDVILNYTMFLDSIGMATSAATIFVLRPRTSHLDGHGIYRMRLYPLLPLIFIAAYLFIAGSIALADPQAALRGLGIFAAFLAIGLVARARRRPTPA
ncbi:MAG: amino acid permease [Myxococcales bacterium]|nr:amino acid permease [Myxococcales bacterium]